ncbi:MAG TPA: anthranilate phosphoribosyltransferase [Anaerolineales bacterium]|nr:anthranilate phosphoribosyltransferase [Anaerolineales bacterium]
MITEALAQLLNNQSLSSETAEAVMNEIMSGDATPAQIAGYLIALRMKGETVPEIAGSARAMRAHARRVHVPNLGDSPLMEVVGTGGDGAHTFNISTATAFVVAGAGYPVAKHGNRSASSRCGSADVLEACGVVLNLTPEQVAVCIQEVGIGFMFAPMFHPAMKHAIGPRRELKQRTLFNLLGPLTNPAGASHILLGVFSPHWVQPIAETLRDLGAKSALVIHGFGGLDELTNAGANQAVRLLPDGSLQSQMIDGETLGLARSVPNDYLGGDPNENAVILRHVLAGTGTIRQQEVVLLNAAAAISTLTGDLQSGLAQARESIHSGKALAKLEKLVQLSRALAG